VGNNGLAMFYASEVLQKDRVVVLTAVSNYGPCLQVRYITIIDTLIQTKYTNDAY
jgi:hypothetical protein